MVRRGASTESIQWQRRGQRSASAAPLLRRLKASERDLVFVHGAAAQASWWDHVAPLLAADRRVTAIDLSGHGDSEWRPAYDMGAGSRRFSQRTVSANHADSHRT